MATQRLNEKQIKKLCEELGVPIVAARIRDNAKNWIDVSLKDGTWMKLLADETIREWIKDASL